MPLHPPILFLGDFVGPSAISRSFAGPDTTRTRKAMWNYVIVRGDLYRNAHSHQGKAFYREIYG